MNNKTFLLEDPKLDPINSAQTATEARSKTSIRTFLVGPESIVLVADPMKLAIFSPVFDAMLFGSLAETDDIEIPDDDPGAFRRLVDYTITGDCDISSLRVAMEMYVLASKYLVQMLQDECGEYIHHNFDKKCGLNIYDCLKMNNAPEAYAYKALEKCAYSAEEILQNDSFLTVNIDTIIDFFKCEELNISSELVLVVALAKYYDTNKSCSIDKIKTALEQIHLFTIEPIRLIQSDHNGIIIKLPNLKGIIQRMFRMNSETRTSTVCRSIFWSDRVFLRGGEFEYGSTIIRKYSTGSIKINLRVPVTFHGVVIAAAGDNDDVEIPKLDIVLTLQDGSRNKMVGERFELNDVNNKGKKCVLGNATLLDNTDYFLCVTFMNDIFISFCHTSMALDDDENITLENCINCNCCPPFENINAILKGLILSNVKE